MNHIVTNSGNKHGGVGGEGEKVSSMSHRYLVLHKKKKKKTCLFSKHLKTAAYQMRSKIPHRIPI